MATRRKGLSAQFPPARSKVTKPAQVAVLSRDDERPQAGFKVTAPVAWRGRIDLSRRDCLGAIETPWAGSADPVWPSLSGVRPVPTLPEPKRITDARSMRRGNAHIRRNSRIALLGHSLRERDFELNAAARQWARPDCRMNGAPGDAEIAPIPQIRSQWRRRRALDGRGNEKAPATCRGLGILANLEAIETRCQLVRTCSSRQT
jgi:hypothetical protein